MNDAQLPLVDELLRFNWMYDAGILSKAALGILAFFCVLLLCAALLRKSSRNIQNIYFFFICGTLLVWSLSSLMPFVFPYAADTSAATAAAAAAGCCVVSVPALMYLHVRRQVSHKEMNAGSAAAVFTVPAILVVLILRDELFLEATPFFPPAAGTWWFLTAFYLYAGAAQIADYLLCFNVMYQMPRRTRSSTRHMLFGISAVAVWLTASALWDMRITGLSELVRPESLPDILLPPAAFCVLLYQLYSAMLVMPACDVIVTSREFVFGSLDTTILVINSRGMILDWNRNTWEDSFPLPRPRFREKYEGYRRRLLQPGAGRASPHNENIIIVSKNGGEVYFLFRNHEVGNKKRSFGSLVEISEITPVYDLLRYFEGIAHFDALTGLHNRNAYFSHIKQAVAEKNMPMLIFVGDVNNLKQINDNSGHLAGDGLLRAVADIIKECAPPGAFTARVGGDEFVVLIPNSGDEEAHRFVAAVIARCEAAGRDSYGVPSISWGYAVMADKSQPYNEVFSKADAMMYSYKKARHSFHSSGLLPSGEERGEVEDELQS